MTRRAKFPFGVRARAAWLVLWGARGRVLVRGYEETERVKATECDHRECRRLAAVCMSRVFLDVEIVQQDHRHVCASCALAMRGRPVDLAYKCEGCGGGAS